MVILARMVNKRKYRKMRNAVCHSSAEKQPSALPLLSFLTKFTIFSIPPFLAIQTKLKLDIRSSRAV